MRITGVLDLKDRVVQFRHRSAHRAPCGRNFSDTCKIRKKTPAGFRRLGLKLVPWYSQQALWYVCMMLVTTAGVCGTKQSCHESVDPR